MKTFEEIIKMVEGRTLLIEEKLRRVHQFAKRSPGICIEVGVYKGGSLRTIGESTVHAVFGFDTFEGMPESGNIDTHKVGDFSDVLVSDVFDYLQECSNRNISVGFGVFPLAFIPNWNYSDFQNNIGFVHLDVDNYLSTKQALEFLVPQMRVGGVILLDDWDWESCRGVRQAVEDLNLLYVDIGYNQAILISPFSKS